MGSDGSGRYTDLTRMYYHKARILIICFEVTYRSSYEACDTWIDTLRRDEPDAFLVVAALRTDVADRKVSSKEAHEHFTSLSLPYFETSAMTGEGVNELFEDTVRMYLQDPRYHRDEDQSASASHEVSSDIQSQSGCIIC